jgi:hypothetical protein
MATTLKLGVHAVLTAEVGVLEMGHKVFISSLSPLTVMDAEGRSAEVIPEQIRTTKGRPVSAAKIASLGSPSPVVVAPSVVVAAPVEMVSPSLPEPLMVASEVMEADVVVAAPQPSAEPSEALSEELLAALGY